MARRCRSTHPVYPAVPGVPHRPIAQEVDVVLLDRLSSRREGVVVIDLFYESGVIDRYPEVFEAREHEGPGEGAGPFLRFARALRRLTKDDASERADLRIADDGIGV